MIHSIQQEILKLKKEKDICILAHSYQTHDILEVADYSGDSYALSVIAKSVPQSTVIMCGVRFMAETVKMLSPEKKVILSHKEASCPMAEQMSKEYISEVKKEFPDYTVVAYINTTTDLKTVCDVCVTSSSAVKICDKIENKNILFIPDCNLGAFVANQLPDKNFKLLNGGCPIHAQITTKDVIKAKKLYPNALLLVHPECVIGISELADYVGSTSGIVEFAKNSSHKEFIIGTELAIAQHLQYDCPDKSFYPLSKRLLCPNMKVTTLVDVLNCVKGTSGDEITLDDETRLQAVKCINKMIELG